MRRRTLTRDLIGTLLVFVALAALVFGFLYGDYWTWANFSAH
jgi:hypothetical protein